MRGFPKTINSRQDVENLLADPAYKSTMQVILQTWLDERYGWISQGTLASDAMGITSPGYKVVEVTDMVMGTSTVLERYQYIWGVDPNNTLAKLAISAAEATVWGCVDRVIEPPI